MSQPEIFYEIELKALLTREQHDRLAEELPRRLNKVNEETVHTTRYRRNGGPEDVRARYSDKTIELVSKEGDPTQLARREIKIPLHSRDTLDHFVLVLEGMGLQPDPPWTKHKTEYKVDLNGYNYTVCLQHIFNFAYILEVEHISEKDDSSLHEVNIRSIMEKLGCEPIDPEQFSQRINDYIRNRRVNY
jgi:hypothetical protein